MEWLDSLRLTALSEDFENLVCFYAPLNRAGEGRR